MILVTVKEPPPIKPLPPIQVPWEVRDAQIVYAVDGRRLFDSEAPRRAEHIVKLHNQSLG